MTVCSWTTKNIVKLIRIYMKKKKTIIYSPRVRTRNLKADRAEAPRVCIRRILFSYVTLLVFVVFSVTSADEKLNAHVARYVTPKG